VANFAVTQSNGNPQFAYPQTLAADLTASPYIYSGAASNNPPIQFFDVFGSTESGAAGKYYGGAIPPPAPIISSVSPGSGLKVGDTLTINGSGFSTIPKEDVVHFPEGITVTANNSPAPTATAFQITIPRSALSGSISVQVGHQVSGSTQLVVLAQSGFAHLSGVAFQPATKDIWLADRGTGSGYPTRIVQLTFSGGTWAKTESETAGSGTIKYQGGQGFDAGQNWFYGLANVTTNGGTRKKPTNPAGAASAFTQVKPGSGDSVSVVGIATAPSLTNTAFFAYYDSTTGEKHIREINGTGILDTDYGNFGVTNLTFASVAGLALDLNGNLFDTETTQVREITPSQTSSILLSGFTTAMGIAVDQVNTSDPGELLVSDSGAGAVYGVDLLLPQKQELVSGLAIPRASSFAMTPLNAATCGKLPNTDLAFTLVGEDTQVRQVPDPRITLLPTAPTRVWISRGRADDQYPSSYQGADHQITITAEAGPDRRVCFRVVDPPDLAPYADGSTTGYWCDNRDPGTSNYAGKLWDTATSAWEDVVCVQADSHGVASATLNTTDRYAGDNYIVQASYDTWDTLNTTKALAQTGVITTWKRIYIEKDTMFRQGGILAANANAGDAKVVVWNWASLPACGDTPTVPPCYQIAVVDSQHPYESNHDEPYISYVVADPNISGANDLYLVQADGVTPYTLSHDYVASPYPAFDSGNSAGVGVIGAGWYTPNFGDMWQAYNDAFVEFWIPPDGCGVIPYLPPGFFDAFQKGTSCSDVVAKPGDLARPWFLFAWIWYAHHGQPNYFWVGGAGNTAPIDPVSCTVCSGTVLLPQVFGVTRSSPQTTESFVFSGAIESYTCASTDQIINAERFTTNHEKGHEFFVNPDTSGGHDTRCQWPSDGGLTCTSDPIPVCSDPASACLMNSSSNPFASRARFDRFDLLCFRTSTCPNGNPGCCDAGSPGCTVPGDGTIRDLTDPLQGVSP
jgi:hypothetical protein